MSYNVNDQNLPMISRSDAYPIRDFYTSWAILIFTLADFTISCMLVRWSADINEL